MRCVFIYILFIVWSSAMSGQDCSSPITACSGVTEILDSTSFSGGFNGPCFTAVQSIFYEFTTNNSADNPTGFLPYEIEADIFIESCIDEGLNLAVNAGIFQPTSGTDPCAGLTVISACVSNSNSFIFSSGALEPNTTYILVLGIDPTSIGFGCNIELTLTGAPLEINACCDDSISLGLSSELEVYGATVTFGQQNYVWSPQSTLDDFQSQFPIATPSSTTVYEAVAQVGDCPVSDVITVTVEQAITVLNTFSPNGDSYNDFWKILRIEGFERALINVYSRWGQVVYKSIGYSVPWDGTNEGKKLAAGTYYYVIELNSLEVTSEPIVGFVVILN